MKCNIPKKEYFVFSEQGQKSRPLNANLFLDGFPRKWSGLYEKFAWEKIPSDVLPKLLYTIAAAYCAATDVLGHSDKKTPSVFFENFVGNIFAREYGINPIRQVQVAIGKDKTMLPTDYLFQPRSQFVKIHLPIKLSTRERSIQAWAHQRVLEGIHGVGSFVGVMVVLSETNLVSKDMSVVEVCLPDQWRLYQMYISRMTRVYYLDLPMKYGELAGKFPYIQVKSFVNFFDEKRALLAK